MTNNQLSNLSIVIIGTALMVLCFPTAPIAVLLSLAWAYIAWYFIGDGMSEFATWANTSNAIASLLAGLVAVLQTVLALTA